MLSWTACHGQGLIESPSTILYHLLNHQLAHRRQHGDVLNLVQSLRILLTYPTLTLLDHRVQSALVLVSTIVIDHLHTDTHPSLADVLARGLDYLHGEEETMRMNMITRGIVILPGIEGMVQIEEWVQEVKRRDFDLMSSTGNMTENGAQEHVRGLMEEVCGHGAMAMAVMLWMNARNGPKRSKGLSYSLRRLAQRRRG